MRKIGMLYYMNNTFQNIVFEIYVPVPLMYWTGVLRIKAKFRNLVNDEKQLIQVLHVVLFLLRQQFIRSSFKEL